MTLVAMLIATLSFQGVAQQGNQVPVNGTDPVRFEHYRAAQPFVKEGNEQLSRGLYAAAITSFRRALREDPDGGFQVNLAEAYAGLKKWSEAAEWYSQTVYPAVGAKQSGPSWGAPKPMLEYALVLLQLNQPAKTVDLYKGSMLGVYESRGDMHVRLPEDYSKKLTAKQMEARLRLAHGLSVQDDRTAIPNIEKATQLDPKLAAAKFYLGKYQYEFRSKAKGKELLEAAASLDGSIRPAVKLIYKLNG